MNATPSKPRSLSARRIALLATTICSLTAASIFVAPSFLPNAQVAHAQNLSQQAQQVARPVEADLAVVAEVRQPQLADSQKGRRGTRAVAGGAALGGVGGEG